MKRVIEFLQKEIDQKHIPGAVIQVKHKGQTLFEDALGWRIDYEDEQERMHLDTVFDLASLTKVVATLPAILKLIDRGELSLSDKVAHFIPEFSVNNKSEITIQNLLTHTSGLQSHRRFYAEDLSEDDIYSEIYKEKLHYPIGSKVIYSDFGLILLKKIVEIVTEEKFEDFVQDEIFKPLGMSETTYRPSFQNDRYAGTEFSETLGTYRLGTVHDGNTEALGGVSGHAGLFSTLSDLNKFVTMFEQDGYFDGKRVLSKHATQLSKKNFTTSLNEARGLGWQMKGQSFVSCGDYFSKHSYGHTGFTGTSIWMDPEVDLNVILLTNRVHYGREPHILRLRPRVHNLIRQEFDR